MNYPTVIPWHYPAGVELTFCNPVEWIGAPEDVERGIAIGYAWRMRKGARQSMMFQQQEWGRSGVYVDSDGVEVASPILKGWKEAISFYRYWRKKADALGLPPWRDGTTGGMGHIHVGGLTEVGRWKVVRDSVARPWLSWAFSHPADDLNCLPLAGAPWQRLTGLVSEQAQDTYWIRKRWAVVPRPTYGTVEFRFFGAPLDEGEQVEHLAFAQAHVRHVIEGPLAKVPFKRGGGRKWLGEWTYRRAKGAFLGWCEEIGLEARDYEKYAVRLMRERFRMGTPKWHREG